MKDTVKKPTNWVIAIKIGKSEQTIKGWKIRFPELYEFVRIGALCKLNGLSRNDVIEMIKLRDIICKK